MTLIDDIKAKIDLVELVEETVALKKSGHTYMGLCPFHKNTDTPALVIWPESQTWKCFGSCDTGGSIFDWVMRRDNLDFKAALEILARRAGMETRPSPEAAEQYQQQRSVADLLTFAADFYYHQLWADSEASRLALETRARRGFNDETLHAIRWGFSRSDDGLLKAIAADRPELLPLARRYGLVRADGRDFTANADGDKASQDGWIIYPHFERGNLAAQVNYLSSRAVSQIDKGSKSRNLPDAVELQPYLLLTGATRHEDGRIRTEALADDILVTEGPADAATCWALGYPAAALMKQNFNPKYDWLLKYLQRQIGRGRQVYVALSHDEAGRIGAMGQWQDAQFKPGVCETIHPLTKVLFWPKEDGQNKSDANSWFQAGGDTEAMAGLLAEPKTYLELVIAQTASLSRQTIHLKHLAGLVSRLGEDDRNDFITIVTDTKGIKTSRNDFNRLVREAIQAQNGHNYAVEITNGLFTHYGEPLASCLIKITHQQLIRSKNEDEITIRYRMQGIHPTGKTLKTVEVLADELDDFRWMSKHWGIDGFLMVGRNKLPQLKNSVLAYSMKEIQREEIFNYTGWETINGKRGFLTASGFLSADGLDTSIKVELSGTQRLYRLPEPPDEIAAATAIEASLSFLDIGPDSITVPLLLSQYAAPLRPLQSFNALMILYGPSQPKNSNTSHVALCHWCDFLKGLSRRDYQTVIDAASTKIKLQETNYKLSDLVSIVDDVPPGSSTLEIIHQREKVETLAREMGNRAGRERWGYTSMPPNVGICMITAEKLAMQVGSAVGRSFTVEFGRDALDLTRLSRAQQHDSALYSQAMAGYVQWLAGHWDELAAGLPAQVLIYQREAEARYSQPRLHDYYATLMTTGATMLRYAKEHNAIDDVTEAAYLERFRQGLFSNLDKQEERIAEMQFSRRFFEALGSLLVQKPFSLMPITGRIYTDELGATHQSFDPPPGASLLGWKLPERGQVYLQDVEALKQGQRPLQEMTNFLYVEPEDLRKEMDYLGLLAQTEKTKRGERIIIQYAVKRQIPARGMIRVLVLDARKIRDLYAVDLLGETPA